jgi:hypothetical protein
MDAANQDELLQRLTRQIEAKAAEFAADPHKGLLAGYAPEHKHRRSAEIGSSQLIKVRSDLAAWMIGIARRDLTGWRWRVDEGLGDMAALSISGPL